MNKADVLNLHRTYLNSSYIDLTQSLGHGTYFKKSTGTKVYDAEGTEYTDFLSGYGVHNIGHNNKELIAHLHTELDSDSPTFLNMDVSKDCAILAKKLTELTHGCLNRVAYANSGSEVVELAIKTARAATKRSPIISCIDGYHGLTLGAISLLTDKTYRKQFGQLLTDIHPVKYGDTQALENKIEEIKPAAFIVEPIQSEGGIIVPPKGYFKEVSRICKKNNVLLIIDEIQTGIGRCGTMLYTDFKEYVPDILLIGKALSGGLVPISACLMTEKVYKKAHHGFEKFFLYSSTFSGGHLASQCGIKILDIIQNSNILTETIEKGNYLLEKLNILKDKHDIIDEVRGAGLLIGIAFKKPKGLLANTLPEKVKDSIYTYVVTAKLMKDFHLILQACSLRGEVMRIEPPLTISKNEIDILIHSLDQTFTEIPKHKSAWNKLIKNKLFKSSL